MNKILNTSALLDHVIAIQSESADETTQTITTAETLRKHFRHPSLELISGSTAYGVPQTSSDTDIISIVVPPIEYLYPHLDGHIAGFFKPEKSFDVFTSHGMVIDGENYDLTVYSIQKFFELTYDNNPNMLELLWIEGDCILSSDNVGKYLIENRKKFISKKSYYKLKGYCTSQYERIKKSTRTNLIEQFGYDTKNAYHAIRLVKQCASLLEHQDMQLTKYADLYTDIRCGVYTYDELTEIYYNELNIADDLFLKSDLPEVMDFNLAKSMLKDCIEIVYGK